MKGLKLYACAAAALLIASLPLAAQGLQGSTRTLTYAVTINVNVANARIFADGVAISGRVAYLKAGPHSIKVTATGYYDYTETINVKSAMTVNAVLKSMGHAVTINVNVPGAVIYVDGAQVAGNVVLLMPGSHSLRVSAAGFLDYVSSLNVAGPLVINAQLKPAGHQVTVNVNVAGATIFIDGVQIAGNTTFLMPGRHSLRVTAAGFTDYVSSLNVAGPMVINAQLAPAGYPLTVTSSVKGALVSINNVAKGPVPYTEYLPPGNYMVVVTAAGYTAYATSVALSGPITINAPLQSIVPASLSFVFPKEYLDTGSKDPQGQIKILIDGKVVSVRGNAPSLKVQPGRHEVEVMSGGLVVRAMDMEFEAGTAYTFELFMELRVKASKR